MAIWERPCTAQSRMRDNSLSPSGLGCDGGAGEGASGSAGVVRCGGAGSVRAIHHTSCTPGKRPASTGCTQDRWHWGRGGVGWGG